jgi:hypothetical protein
MQHKHLMVHAVADKYPSLQKHFDVVVVLLDSCHQLLRFGLPRRLFRLSHCSEFLLFGFYTFAQGIYGILGEFYEKSQDGSIPLPASSQDQSDLLSCRRNNCENATKTSRSCFSISIVPTAVSLA